jgi:hypothetical protein
MIITIDYHTETVYSMIRNPTLLCKEYCTAPGNIV